MICCSVRPWRQICKDACPYHTPASHGTTWTWERLSQLWCVQASAHVNYDLHMCELVFCQGVSWALCRHNLVALNNSCGQRLPVLGPKILCASWFQPHSSLWICTCTCPVDIFLQALLFSLANTVTHFHKDNESFWRESNVTFSLCFPRWSIPINYFLN